MTCRELADFILAYVDGELTGADRQAFEYHLSRCPNCARYLSEYRATTERGRGAFRQDDGTLSLPDDLVQAILRSRAAGRS